MEIKITGTPDDIKKLLNAIEGSKEQPTIDVASLYDCQLKNGAKRYKPTD